VACVAGDRQGHIYNVNADQMAAACACGFAADRLFFLTDVDGVRGADGSIMARLTVEESARLIRDGIATGGMQAKLTAVTEALKGGIAEVVIAGGAIAGITSRLLSGDGGGTHCVLE
jgi:acetylglutamate kinase